MANTVTIFFKAKNSYKDYPIGTTLYEILHDLKPESTHQIVAAKVNNKTEDLNFAVYKPKDIDFVDINTSSGMRVYVRTLALILAKAINELFPQANMRLEHPLSKGYFCTLKNLGRSLNAVDIEKIKAKMTAIVAQNLPINKREKQADEVIGYFKEQNQMDKVLLLETLGRTYVEYYELDGFLDYYSGALLPSTGHINLFDTIPYYDGLLLRIPSRTNPLVLEEIIPQPKMYEIFNEFITWNGIMGIDNVGEFNLAGREKRAYELIKIAEALHEKKIAGIADQIINSSNKPRFVMISGPSSSGKTTFSKRLAIQLMVGGLKPLTLSLDNYFVDRPNTPVDENGQLDYESLYALDLDFFNQQLQQLLNGEEIIVPSFNFETGKRQFKNKKLKLENDSILIMEGIHALNCNLTPTISEQTKFKIYVSALTTISLDNHNWIPTSDNRLLRRIIRDYKYRGYSAQDTISRWASVRKGEEKWIFPFQENADVMFNSALIFELAVLKHYAEPILLEVPRNSDEYAEAHRLLKFLKYFMPIYDREVPPTSLLREFLGGSSFHY
ncbi:MAG: nucleoside kinase [Paludibacteraceae bacterium]|nr:nucleoside kinase [Paludibacteraceae bacterium]